MVDLTPEQIVEIRFAAEEAVLASERFQRALDALEVRDSKHNQERRDSAERRQIEAKDTLYSMAESIAAAAKELEAVKAREAELADALMGFENYRTWGSGDPKLNEIRKKTYKALASVRESRAEYAKEQAAKVAE